MVAAEHDDGSVKTWHARFVLDASGRDTFLGNRFKAKAAQRQAQQRRRCTPTSRGAKRNEGKAEGNISIFWFEHGWFWFIPLADGTTSIGAVTWPYYLKTRKKPLRDFLLDTIALCPQLAERLEGAELVVRSRGHRQLFLSTAATATAPTTCCWATPSPSSIRCSPPA